MSAKRAPAVLSITLFVLLAGGASQPQARDAGVEARGGARPRGVVPGSGSSAAPLAEAPCFLHSLPFDVHSDADMIGEGDIVYNPHHDEYLVVWAQRSNAQTIEIWAARVVPDGAVRDTFKVAGEEGKELQTPTVAYGSRQDQYLVAYELCLSGSSNIEVSATRVSWNGSWKSNQFPIGHGPDDQRAPKVAYSSAHDEYLVVHSNVRSDRHDVTAQRVRAGDSALLSSHTFASGAGEYRYDPDVAFNEARDEYLAVYALDTSTSDQMQSSRFTHDMATVDPEVTISNLTHWTFGHPSVAAGPDEYLVVWHVCSKISGELDVRGQRISVEGNPLGPNEGIDIAGARSTVDHSNPEVAYSAPVGYLVALVNWTPELNYEVVGRFVEPGNDVPAGALFPLFEFPENQTWPQVACAPGAHCLIVEWDEWDPEGMNQVTIRGQLLRPCPRVFLPLVLGNR